MWLVGGIYGYGYNVWVWLVGVVMRYIDILIIIINFTYSTCIRSFFGSSILTSLFIFKCFFGLIYRQCGEFDKLGGSLHSQSYAYLYLYALLDGEISIRDPYICAVLRV